MTRAHRSGLGIGVLLTLVAAPAAADPRDIAAPQIRPRAGISLIGGGTVGEPDGSMVGGSVRAGVQLGDVLATYYQATFLYAALTEGTELESGGDSDNAFVMWNSFLVDVTLFDVVAIGAGPSIDIYADCEREVQTHRGCAGDSPFFGLHGRIALQLGRWSEIGRDGVTLSFEVHPTWFGEDQETISLLGGMGFDLY